MKSKFTWLLFILTSLAVSCKDDDHAQPEGEGCKLLGMTTIQESKYYAEKQTEIIKQEFELREDKFPLNLTKTWSSTQLDTVSQVVGLRVQGNSVNTFVYNGDGFLTKRTDRSSKFEEAGETYNLFYATYGPVKKLSTEINVTTDYKYENGLLSESVYKYVTTYRSEPRPDVTEGYEVTKRYTYDAQKNLVSISNIDTRGFQSLSKYENGLIVSLTGNNQQPVSTYENANGKLLRNTLSDGSEFRYQYDQRGNLTNLQVTNSNKVPYLVYEYQYDNKPIPESLIPTKFKGIPEPVTTIQVINGVNNRLLDKTTSYSNGNLLYVNEYKIMHTYNNSGYPVSSLSKLVSGNLSGSIQTTYKYGNCP